MSLPDYQNFWSVRQPSKDAKSPLGTSILRPGSASSNISNGEVIEPATSKQRLNAWQLGFAFWLGRNGISRNEYTALQEILALVSDPEEFKKLPMKLDTLTKYS